MVQPKAEKILVAGGQLSWNSKAFGVSGGGDICER